MDNIQPLQPKITKKYNPQVVKKKHCFFWKNGFYFSVQLKIFHTKIREISSAGTHNSYSRNFPL